VERKGTYTANATYYLTRPNWKSAQRRTALTRQPRKGCAWTSVARAETVWDG